MTVGELIEMLQKVEPDRVVVLASDGDGSLSGELEGGFVAAFDDKSGRLGLEVLDQAAKAAGFTEADVVDGVRVLVLMPYDDEDDEEGEAS